MQLISRRAIMIKGFVITPPVLGRISIGCVVEKNGQRLPEKDDQFTLTTQVQRKDGWITHPLDKELRESTNQEKLRTIPIRLPFNQPELNFRAEYNFFSRKTGRPVCIGDGEQCKRRTDNGIEQLPCPGPELCEFGKGGLCKPYGRLNVTINEQDTLGTFIFRTTGFNSLRTLSARLHYYQAVSSNLLSCLPLALKLRGKSSAQSFKQTIYYVDIVIDESLTIEQAISQAKVEHENRVNSGFNQEALDSAAARCFANGAFEYDEDEGTNIVEEFYSDSTTNSSSGIQKTNNDDIKAKIKANDKNP